MTGRARNASGSIARGRPSDAGELPISRCMPQVIKPIGTLPVGANRSLLVEDVHVRQEKASNPSLRAVQVSASCSQCRETHRIRHELLPDAVRTAVIRDVRYLNELGWRTALHNRRLICPVHAALRMRTLAFSRDRQSPR